MISIVGSHNVEPFSMTALNGVVGLQSTPLYALLVSSSSGPKYRSIEHYGQQSLHGCVSMTINRW